MCRRLIDRGRILTLIPHAGAMCLLDAVLGWDTARLRAVSRRYCKSDNPLRRPDGVLGAACGIEIAAQAMAVHGRLSAGDSGPASQGALASLRDVQFRRGHLDGLDDDLLVDVERLAGDAAAANYRFMLTGGGAELLSGRATVLLRPAS